MLRIRKVAMWSPYCHTASATRSAPSKEHFCWPVRKGGSLHTVRCCKNRSWLLDIGHRLYRTARGISFDNFAQGLFFWIQFFLRSSKAFLKFSKKFHFQWAVQGPSGRRTGPKTQEKKATTPFLWIDNDPAMPAIVFSWSWIAFAEIFRLHFCLVGKRCCQVF